jgi:Domain of unknown function (DUF4352)
MPASGYNRALAVTTISRRRKLKRKKLMGGVPSVLVAAGVVFLVVVGFIAGCGGEEAPSSSADGVDEQAEAEQKAEPAQEESAKAESAASIGDPVSLGDAQWTVTDVVQSDMLVSRLGTEEGNFIIVDVTFSNNSNQDVTLATPFLTLLDGQGREIEADIEDNFLHVYASENMFVDHVKPGATKEGKVIFSVDPDASGLKLQVGEARFASNKTAYIDLGTPRPASEVL